MIIILIIKIIIIVLVTLIIVGAFEIFSKGSEKKTEGIGNQRKSEN